MNLMMLAINIALYTLGGILTLIFFVYMDYVKSDVRELRDNLDLGFEFVQAVICFWPIVLLFYVWEAFKKQLAKLKLTDKLISWLEDQKRL